MSCVMSSIHSQRCSTSCINFIHETQPSFTLVSSPPRLLPRSEKESAGWIASNYMTLNPTLRAYQLSGEICKLPMLLPLLMLMRMLMLGYIGRVGSSRALISFCEGMSERGTLKTSSIYASRPAVYRSSRRKEVSIGVSRPSSSAVHEGEGRAG